MESPHKTKSNFHTTYGELLLATGRLYESVYKPLSLSYGNKCIYCPSEQESYHYLAEKKQTRVGKWQ
jgi:hypothetical protein